MEDPRRYLGLHTVGMLRELIRKWWQVDIGLADDSGRLVDDAWGNIPPSGNDFCRALLSSGRGKKKCLRSIREINAKLSASSPRQEAVAHVCHLGFGMAASALHARERYRGFVFACGFSSRELSRTRLVRLRGTVKEIGSPETGLAGERVPVLSREDVERMKDLLAYGAREMERFDRDLDFRQTLPSAKQPSALPGIVSRSRAMAETCKRLVALSTSGAPLLFCGADGTGKRILARAVHQTSTRRKGPFVVFASNGPAHTREIELFGHVRGGSIGKLGAIERARGGSAYLPAGTWAEPEIQVKLLRLIRENTIVPVGSDGPVEADVRLLLSHDGDFEHEAAAGSIRQDLADKLSDGIVRVPPLARRSEDLDELIRLFVERYKHPGRQAPRIGSDVLSLLKRYSWPGNANELESEIRTLLNLCPGGETIAPEHVSLKIRQAVGHGSKPLADALEKARDLKSAIEVVERQMIQQGLVRTRFNKSRLARQLGISRSNLLAKIEKYGLEKKSGRRE